MDINMLFVTKRDGRKENVHFDKITKRIKKLVNPIELQNIDLPYLNLSKEVEYLDPVLVTQKVVASLYSGITTEELDIESAEICVNLSTKHPSYSYLGGRILVSNLHKKTIGTFSDKMQLLQQTTNNINKNWLDWVISNSDQLNQMIDYNRDYLYDYFGFKTLEKSYLLKSTDKIIERPQDMLLRVASTLQQGDLTLIKKTYDFMSLGYYTHASPTMFNSGTNHMQMSSCFVENTEVMTMNGIKKIQEINIGDKVVSHTGQIKNVSQVHKNPLNNRDIYKLIVHKSKPIYVTGNHRFWAISKDNEKPRWISIEEMNRTLDCRIAIPSYKGTLKNKIDDNYKGDENIIIDNDLANIMGMFIGNGHIITTNGKIDGIGFTVHKDNKKEIDFISKVMEKSFGIETLYHNIKDQNVTQILYNSQTIGQLFNYMFGEGFNGENMVNWDIEMIYNFLAGLITTNGCISKEGIITIQMSNYDLMNQLYHLFRMYGITVSLNEVNTPPKLDTVTPWIMNVPEIKYVLESTLKLYNDNRLENCIEKIDQRYKNHPITKIINGVSYLKIQTLHKTDLKPDYVYTIGVDDDHSYNVEGLICENCFLLGTNDDLTDIATTWNSCAQISKWSGGIGLHVSNIRGKNSLIKSTNGKSNGLVPFLKVFNDIARWIDQGGKRPGSIAIYLEPHHPDIFEFLELRKNFGSETERARDLFMALWISDLFMKQVESDGDWYLLSADECPGLTDAYGDGYEELYWKYVNENKYRKIVKARKLWLAILEAQIETGMPYISYKDAVNIKSNQKNLGTIKSSNLCNEINQYSDDKEYAVCNLASISLKSFVKPWTPKPDNKWIIYTKPNCKYCNYAKSYLTNNQIYFIEIPFNNETLSELKQKINLVKITFPQIFIETNGVLEHIGGWSDMYKFTAGTFDYDKLYEVAYLAVINLNQVIDINYYPVPQTKYSNMRHRPIGLGIQALADALVLMRIPYDSEQALKFNEKYMETIYLASMTASNDIAIKRTNPLSILISYFNQINFKYPEYYSSELFISDSNINRLYHELKPNKWELSRDPNLSTIGSYSSFDGSPLSQGKFQFDLWNKQPEQIQKWNKLRESVIKYGTRNSLLTALMPTASTSQILGNNECFEFFTNNIYTRKTHAGDFILVNKYLVNDLIKINLWSPEFKDRIIASNGSIQTIDEIPPEFKQIYKTIWEIKQIWVLKGAVARGPYVDQTQSMNIFMAEPDYQRLGSSHFWAWKNGLKTGMYYLRTKPSADAIKFTIDPKLTKLAIDTKSNENNPEETLDGCLNCSA
jgi:ribonucleoside-diphosphate reductase alpha subunit